MDDFDMPPELEELPTELIKKNKAQQPPLSQKNDKNLAYGDITQTREEPKVVSDTKPEKKKEAFGGLKKGFFSAPSQPKKKEQDTKKENNIIEVKKPTKPKDSLVIDEVQKSMGQSILDKKDEWMNADLLTKIGNNPKLAKLFANQEYMQAITKMQKQPKEVMEQYKNNQEFQELLAEFSKIMGSHFEGIGQKKQEPEQPQISKRAQEAMADPQVQAFLMYMKQNPTKIDFNQVRYKDPKLAEKLKILVEEGLIQLNSF